MTIPEALAHRSPTLPWIVSIDTSSDRSGVAVFDGASASVVAWHARRNQTVDTLAQLDHVLRLARVDRSSLGGIAVATGPGSFSALRVGLSTAKALAFAWNLPLVGVPTTDAIAASVGWVGKPVVAVMSAGRGRLAWTTYVDGKALGPPQNTSTAELGAASTGDVILTGETEAIAHLDPVEMPVGARVEQVARIGWRRLAAGERDDPAALEPIYAHGRRTVESRSA